ncbi:branched-chain amino acid ABC transporter permease [Microbacterium sp. ASV49]|uniref:Branched-chain amino acid ABC transporter permease n=1 Tax=Microbacterium candidum TaxID=3041922 RepID=A0ABT7MWE3_9MICO|nr:branched-chain amino acid ABC transporter permease [Microbacterium sp. ASV49]MDL9978773.1 branched-chain amino acid ABC transporter permease [Microbacterium sp. ASV49]
MNRLLTRAGMLRAGIFFAALVVIPFLGGPSWLLNMLIFTVMYAALSSSWNIVGGFAGYPSLGHAAFFGIGAYSVGIAFSKSVGDGYAPFFALPLIGLAVALVAVPIGWVSMRTRQDVFAIVTITILFMAQTLAFNLTGLTGGAQGTSVAPAPFPPQTYAWPFYFGMVVLLAISMGFSYLISNSKFGLSLLTIRADEDKAHGIGVRVTAAKVTAFALSAGLVAMVGGVWAYYVGFIYPQFAIDPLVTIGMVLMTFLGGKGTIWGPVLGAFILVPAQEYFAQAFGANQLYLLAYAAVFIVIMLFLPRGIIPSVTAARRRRQAAAKAGPTIPPDTAADAGTPAPAAIVEVTR